MYATQAVREDGLSGFQRERRTTKVCVVAVRDVVCDACACAARLKLEAALADEVS